MSLEIKLPDLRIVEIPRCILHEQSDPLRAGRIAERLKEEKILGNPPVVGEVKGSDRLIVLDGANRVTAAEVLPLAALMVQVVDYADPSVRLQRWHHLLIDFDPDRFLHALEKIPGATVQLMPRPAAEASLNERQTAAVVVLREREHYVVRAADGAGEAAVMRSITDIYKRKTQIYRIADERMDLLVSRAHENVTAVILFPGFKKSDLTRIALRDGEKLPPGITRHFIPNRALKVNLPLSMLQGRATLAERNARLEAFIARKVKEKKIRAYPEPTVIFDE